MTDEQKHAIEHAQKVLRAVKLYDRAASLADDAQPVATEHSEEWMKGYVAGLRDYESKLALNEPACYIDPQGLIDVEDLGADAYVWSAKDEGSIGLYIRPQIATRDAATIDARDAQRYRDIRAISVAEMTWPSDAEFDAYIDETLASSPGDKS